MSGGRGINGRARISGERRTANDRELSDRHRFWGHDVPCVDLDFLLCEFNHGVPVAVVDYKFHLADIGNTNELSFSTLGRLYNEHGEQLPFFIARYWPDVWAFKVKPENPSAREWMQRVFPDRRDEWVAMTEREYVAALYRLRKDALTVGDERYIARLNAIAPPPEEAVA